MSFRWHPHVTALCAYAVVAIAFNWPLPFHLGTHLTGPPESDAGVYVWNQWVFHHELVENRAHPYFTSMIFAASGRADLALHNYTSFANLLALPFVSWFGVVATFNLVYLAIQVITAYATFRLARHFTSGSNLEAWVAGLLFAWCPMLVTRGGGHYSLVAAAPLPVFIALMLRVRAQLRMRDAVALGVTVAWAFTADVYYAVYCVLIAAGFLVAEVVRLDSWSRVDGKSRVTWALDLLILCLAALVAAILVSRGWSFQFLGRVIRMRGLYTPMLVLTVLLIARAFLTWRPAWKGAALPDVWRAVRLGTVGALVAAIMLSPVLYAMSVRIAQGRFVSPKIYWRSSPRGLDLVSVIAPNPNHPLAPESLRQWLTARPDGYLEAVGSVSFVALALLVFAARRGWRPPRLWVAGAIGAVLVSMGPFLHVAGINTQIPGPWAFMRYLPIVGLARSPSRFYVVAMLALAVLVASALAYLRRSSGLRPVAIVAALIAFELLPSPRLLASARVPDFYYAIAADPRPDISVLELPFGIRDGASSVGNFTARSQFVQIVHGKPILGGYLSRVSRRRVESIRRMPVRDALIRLSEGAELTPLEIRAAAARVPRFMERTKLGYVVIDRKRASPTLIRFATEHLNLIELDSDGDLTLYRPAHLPP